MPLPLLNRNTNQTHTEVTRNISHTDSNKINYLKQKASQYISNSISGSLDVIGCLSSEILEIAPEWYFNKIQSVALKLTVTIQDILSRSDKAGLISQIKENPTDLTIRETAFSAINSEFLRFDSNQTPTSFKYEYDMLDKIEKDFVLAMVVNEICGLGPLEPLYRDFSIREIICNGPYDIQIERGGELFRIPSCKFQDTEHLESLVSRLYNSVNKDITRTNPYERARLHDNSRIFAVHTSVAPTGPNLNIRRHTDEWISPIQQLEWNSMSREVAEWIGNHIYYGCSFIVNGGTASGKTTMLASLLGYLPNNKRLITIEKNIEIKPPKNKMIAAAMECIPRKNNNSNFEITMRDLVECTTQMRPDVIVCGEVVGDEAYDLVQAGNTGHQVFSTLHSNSSQDCMNRLMSMISQSNLIKGKDALDLIASSIDFVISLERNHQDGSRRIVDISEVATECARNEAGTLILPTRPIWKFIQDENTTNSFNSKITGRWEKVGEVSRKRTEAHSLHLVKHKTLEELSKELF